MQTHMINRQLDIISSYIAYLENSNKYIDVLNASRLKEKIEEIKKVYRYASDISRNVHLSICDFSIGLLEFNNGKATCRMVIESMLCDLRGYLEELKKSRSKVDRTVATHC